MRSRVRLLVLFLPVLLVQFGAGAGSASAEVFRVPEDYATLADALAASDEGDVIEIAAGTYTAPVTINAKHERVIRGRGRVVFEPFVGSALTLLGCDYITIERIEFQNAPVRGIDAFDCDKLVLSRCTVVGSGAEGIFIDRGSAALIEKCKVREFGQIGIRVESDQCVVTGCTVVDRDNAATGDAIRLVGTANRATRNKITGSGDDGIQVGNSLDATLNNVVSGNTIRGVPGDGIILAVASATLVHGNRVSGSGQDGIDVGALCDADVLSANRVAGAAGDGIELDGDDTKVEGCIVKRAAGHGILIETGAAGNLLAANRIKRALLDGVHAESETHTLVENRTRRSGEDGYEDETAPGSSNVLIGNRFD